MGQAKLRGTFQDRAAAAKARLDALRPKVIICNECKGEITEIVDLDAKGVVGIDAAFAGICPTCKSPTYAIKGEPEAVGELMNVMADVMGGAPLVGVQTKNG